MAVVKVVHPFQVVNAGQVYRPGETADVSLHLATYWIENGWAVKDDSATANEAGDSAGKPGK